MINPYQALTTHTGFDFEDYLERLNLLRIFMPIFEEFQDKEDRKNIVLYIVFTHSIESTKLTVGGDRRKEINSIFKGLGLSDKLYEEIVLMKSSSVVRSAQLWMEFKDNRQIEYLFTLQNAYVQQQAAALSNIKKATFEIDYDQKMRCIEHMTELRKMIKDAESELQQNDSRLKEAYEEVRKSNKKSTMGANEVYSL